MYLILLYTNVYSMHDSDHTKQYDQGGDHIHEKQFNEES